MTQPTVSKHWRRVVSHPDTSQSHQTHLTMLAVKMASVLVPAKTVTYVSLEIQHIRCKSLIILSSSSSDSLHQTFSSLVASTTDNIHYLLRWRLEWLEQVLRGLDSIMENPRRALGTLVFITVFRVWPDEVLCDPCTVHRTRHHNNKTMLTNAVTL